MNSGITKSITNSTLTDEAKEYLLAALDTACFLEEQGTLARDGNKDAKRTLTDLCKEHIGSTEYNDPDTLVADLFGYFETEIAKQGS